MLISEKYKYIFISIPKTGTTAIQSFLLKNDSTCVINQVKIGEKQIEVDEHIKAKKLKKIMGEDEYARYTIFTFIRDPYSRRVSGYFFYRNGNTLKSHYFVRNFMARVNVILTKILPFSIWSVIKPQKKLVDYFFDNNNNLLIDLVGKTENLDEDLLSICRLIGISLKDENIPVKNRSKHSSVDEYFSNKFHKKLYGKMAKEDIELYQKYKQEIYTGSHISKVC